MHLNERLKKAPKRFRIWLTPTFRDRDRPTSEHKQFSLSYLGTGGDRGSNPLPLT